MTRAAALETDQETAVSGKIIQYNAGTAHHAGQRVFSDPDAQIQFIRETFSQPMQQRPAARQANTNIHQVGHNFGRYFVQGIFDRLDNH